MFSSGNSNILPGSNFLVLIIQPFHTDRNKSMELKPQGLTCVTKVTPNQKAGPVGFARIASHAKVKVIIA
jgi:hypothetical protein